MTKKRIDLKKRAKSKQKQIRPHTRETGYSIPKDLGLPWSLRFLNNGTENIGVICQSEGGFDDVVIATSRGFWLPEDNDPIPGTLSALQLMVAAPKLFDALRVLLAADGSSRVKRARKLALSTLAEASPHQP